MEEIFMYTEDRVFHLGTKPSIQGRRDAGVVSHLEYNVTIGEEILSMPPCRHIVVC